VESRIRWKSYVRLGGRSFLSFEIHPTIWGQKAKKISDSFLALIKRKRILEPLSRSCHVEVLQKKEPQNPIQFSMFYSILVGEEPDSVFLKKEGKQNQVKMIWIAPSSCAKDLTISEGTGATFLFNFHSRVSISFHALFLRPRNMKWTNSFS